MKRHLPKSIWFNLLSRQLFQRRMSPNRFRQHRMRQGEGLDAILDGSHQALSCEYF
jgi:hypothetical protein